MFETEYLSEDDINTSKELDQDSHMAPLIERINGSWARLCQEATEMLDQRYSLTLTLALILFSIISFTLNAVLLGWLSKFRRLHINTMTFAINAAGSAMIVALGLAFLAVVDSIQGLECPLLVNAMKLRAEKGTMVDLGLYALSLSHIFLALNRYVATNAACRRFHHIRNITQGTRWGQGSEKENDDEPDIVTRSCARKPGAVLMCFLIWVLSGTTHAATCAFWHIDQIRSGKMYVMGQSTLYDVPSGNFVINFLVHVLIPIAILVPFGQALGSCRKQLKDYYLNHVSRNSVKLAIAHSVQITEMFFPGSACFAGLLMLQQVLILCLRLALESGSTAVQRYVHNFYSSHIWIVLAISASTVATLCSMGKLRRSPAFAFFEAQRAVGGSLTKRGTVAPSIIATPANAANILVEPAVIDVSDEMSTSLGHRKKPSVPQNKAVKLSHTELAQNLRRESLERDEIRLASPALPEELKNPFSINKFKEVISDTTPRPAHGIKLPPIGQRRVVHHSLDEFRRKSVTYTGNRHRAQFGKYKSNED